MRAAALLLAGLPLAGCVYFNGIYNAQRAEHRADALRRAGRTGDADSLYRVAVASADSVLVHHPRSKWAGSAELIAGWSLAMSAECEAAEPLLRAVRIRSGTSLAAYTRAQAAAGICAVRAERYREGRALLLPVVGAADAPLSEEAAVWAAVASQALGEPDSARAMLENVDTGRVEWQLARISLERGRWAAAESLLTRRAERGDYRPDLLSGITQLWRAGRRNGVVHIVARFDRARVSAVARARIHRVVGTLALDAGDDSLARASFETLARLTRDSTEARDARALLTQLALRDLPELADVRTTIEQGRARASGAPLQRRLEDNLLLVELLRERDDGTGAGTFLAAEVARDSLGALALAHALFLEIASHPRSPVAERAWRAASDLAPQVPDLLAARTAVAGPETRSAGGEVALPGPGRGAGSAAVADSVLRDAWSTAMAAFADSVRQRASTVPRAAAASSGVPPVSAARVARP